ncbi:MAG TPA: arsenate reductase ArsC [Methylocella sp.]|nr:arsenate reductase ArsC [Methylocella sp.]
MPDPAARRMGAAEIKTAAKNRPQAVLFACTRNAVRSPMAEAIGRHLFGRDIYFASAGVKRGEANAFARAVMDEIGIDMSKHRPRTFEDLDDSCFDLIVTLSPEAHHKALEFTRALATEVVYWPTMDPTAIEGSRERVLDAYRSVRDSLMSRIKGLLGYQPMGNL